MVIFHENRQETLLLFEKYFINVTRKKKNMKDVQGYNIFVWVNFSKNLCCIFYASGNHSVYDSLVYLTISDNIYMYFQWEQQDIKFNFSSHSFYFYHHIQKCYRLLKKTYQMY
jgi:hypothetical protein